MSISGVSDSGTRPPSGSTTATGRFRPAYRLATIFESGAFMLLGSGRVALARNMILPASGPSVKKPLVVARCRRGSLTPLAVPPKMTASPMSAERAPRNAITERRFRDALAQFATGVTMIAARGDEEDFVGFTATSFNSVSLDPPLIIWSLGRRSRSLAAFENASRYAVNVLAHDQVDLARRFSRPHADRFAGVPYRLGVADAPLIVGCVAWLEC